MESKKPLLDHLNFRRTEDPDDEYFGALPDQLMKQLHSQDKKGGLKLIRHPAVWVTAIAASILLLVTIRIVNNTNGGDLSFDQVSSEEVIAYIDNNLEEFDEELLLDALNEEPDFPELQEYYTDTTKKVKSSGQPVTSGSKQQESVNFETLTEEDILNYLKEQGMSEEELEESIEEL